MDNGWIKLHRSLLEWEWYDDTNVKILFLHLMLRANHKPTKYRGVDIPAGAIVTGRDALATQLGLSPQKIRTAINKLKSTNEITITSSNKFTVIELTKWDSFQSGNQQNNKRATNEQPTDNQQVTTSKECKKEEGKKEEDIHMITGISNSSDSLQNQSKEKQLKLSKTKLYSESFEELWKPFLPFNRRGDNKKIAHERYLACVREGFSSEHIKEGLRALAKINKERPADKRKGMAYWLYPDNIQAAMDGEFEVEKVGQEVNESSAFNDKVKASVESKRHIWERFQTEQTQNNEVTA